MSAGSGFKSVARRGFAAGALACLLVAGARGQYDPDAPEPIAWREGSLIVAGPGRLSAPGARRFAALAPDGGAVLVVVLAESAGPAAGAEVAGDSFWREVRRVEAPTRAAAEDPALVGALADAGAAWIPDQRADLGALWAGTALARALEGLMDRGGVVGAHGASGSFLGARIPDAPTSAGLGLLPGAVVVTGPDLAGLEERLKQLLPERRELVGYAVPAGGTLVLDRRRVEMADGVRGRALIAPWRDRPWRSETIDDEHWIDLVLLSRAAVSRTLPAFPPARPPRTEVPHGTLILAGGAGTPAGLLERFVALAGGPDAPIVFIPCAGGPLLDEPSAVADLRRAGGRRVTWVHATRRQADGDESILGPLREARGIWFGGGRHWHFVDAYQDTAAHRLMHAVLERGGVIGGWSAGASIQSDFMTRGDPRNVRDIVAEGYERGLGFLPGAAVDQHFSERGRLPDLAWLVTQYPQLLGIGLDETTALIVQGQVAEVMADRADARVYFFGRNRPTVPADQRYEALADGERYDLVRRGRLLPGASD